MQRIYLDHAATTPLDTRVLDAMLPWLTERFGNASSAHALGRKARGAVEESRYRIARHLGAEPREIVFTSGGTESDNAALRGIAPCGGLITSVVEHEAVLRCAEDLGRHVTLLMPGPSGTVSPDDVERAISEDTRLVSLMYVNNEIGSVTSLAAIAKVCRRRGVPLHTDAAQVAGLLPWDVNRLGVDLMSLSGHKMYGPKGMGVLYVRTGLAFRPFVLGGAQERSRRGGTENVAAIVGLACAMDLAQKEKKARAAHVTRLRKRLENRIRDTLQGGFMFNTPLCGVSQAAPHILNLSFSPVDGQALDGEMLLLNLDLQGVMASAGSACTSGAVEPSHVLMALGRDRSTASASLRFSLGKDTTAAEIDTAVTRLAGIIERMRSRRAV